MMFIGQLGWAAVGAACGTLLAALAAEVKPEDKVDLLAYSRPPAPLLLLAA
ncbi:sucrose symporter [Cutibacterium acnes JCM 18918]|nr:sucrose symporter [Cutibacterium acnes JCM 18918]